MPASRAPTEPGNRVNDASAPCPEAIPSTGTHMLDRIRTLRLELLGETERVADSRAADVEAVLRALFFPDFRLSQEIPQARRLVRRLHREPDEKPHRSSASHLKEAIQHFQDTLANALPDLSRKELLWRMHFLLGAMIHAGLSPSDMERLSEVLRKASDAKGVLKQILVIAAAGLRAQLVSSQEVEHEVSRA